MPLKIPDAGAELVPLFLEVSPYHLVKDMAGNRVSGLALTAVVEYWTGAGEIINDTVYRHLRPPPDSIVSR